MDETRSLASQCNVKAAECCLQLPKPDFERAIKLYEKVVAEYLKKDIMMSNAKQLALKIWLCHLANDDLIGAQNRYTDYCSSDRTFVNGREGVFVNNLWDIKENNDVDRFEKTWFNYNKVTPFDKIQTIALEHAKSHLDPIKQLNLAGDDPSNADKVPDLT